MTDYLFIAIGLIGGLAVIFLAEGGIISTPKKVSKPPSLIRRWKAKHPNGMTTHIKYRQRNPNGKLEWQIVGMDFPIVAEIGYDVIVEEGAEAGEKGAFFIFNVNPDGTPQEWVNPSYKQYFARKNEDRKMDDYGNVIKNRQDSIRFESDISMDRRVDDRLDEMYTGHGYVYDRYAPKIRIKKSKGGEILEPTDSSKPTESRNKEN